LYASVETNNFLQKISCHFNIVYFLQVSSSSEREKNLLVVLQKYWLLCSQLKLGSKFIIGLTPLDFMHTIIV